MKPTTILGGSIGTLLQPLQNGKVQFFLAPDDGANIQSGQGGQGHQGQQGGASNQNQNQQQQQQQPPTFKDPFEGVDLDLLDEGARKAIETSRTEMQRLHNEAQTGRTFQSQADRYKVELDRLKAGNGQQQQQSTNIPLTMEQEIYKELTENMGVPPEEAKKIAPFQAKMLGVLGNRTREFVGNSIAPMADTIAMQQAESTFSNLVNHTDPSINTWFANPDVASAVWAKVKENAAQGVDMPPGAVVNLAKIFYVDHHQANGNGSPLQLPNMQQNQQQNQQQSGTALRYPGAGSHAPAPTFRPRGAASMDADTAAALSATKEYWNAWTPKGAPTQNVTRSR